MPTRRQLFELFTKSDLVKIATDLGYRGWSVLNKGEIVARLAKKRSVPVDEILTGFKISELRSLCLKLELNPGRLKRQTLIDRITGNESKISQTEVKKQLGKKSEKKINRNPREQGNQ